VRLRGRRIVPWLFTPAVLAAMLSAGGPGANARLTTAAQAASVPFDTSEWKTDFTKHSAPLAEIMSGGPPKDGIPAIDMPEFVSVAAADEWLKPKEPVVFVERNGDARAYPLQILIWHEITNDTVGGVPVAITFCPLCNTAIAFDRRVGPRVLDFGTTGRLRFSDLVMYDRQTESWWQQATGEAIVGELTGTHLVPLPAQIISWDTFKRAFPDGHVLSRHTGSRRPYGRNPYAGYDSVDSSPFLYRGPRDARLRPMERVVTVSIGADDAAYPFSVLQKVHVVNDGVGGRKIVVLFESGVTSALDQSSIAESRDIGTAAVFERTVNGRTLTFVWTAGQVSDQQTGSAWGILGTAVAGPLKGARLTPVVHGQPFWFAWAVFRPNTRVYQPH
jgi:Protein of unknown function (DUF3179)